MLNKKLTVIIDRPLGSRHPKYPDLTYPVNYGFVPGVLGGDGQDQDCYILGVAEPLTEFQGTLVATIKRSDDVEDKWVVVPEGTKLTKEEIIQQVHFQEQYFDSVLIMLEPANTILFTKRLILRSFLPADFSAVYSWALDPENVRYMAWGPNDESETRAFLDRAKPGQDFAVVLTDTQEVIGSCGLYPDSSNDTGELGWILKKDFWKQGFGTELGRELVRYGFEDLSLRRIFAPCAADNYGSYRVMERIGLRREAHHLKAFWLRVDQKWTDEFVYAMLRDEYFLGKKRSPGNTCQD